MTPSKLPLVLLALSLIACEPKEPTTVPDTAGQASADEKIAPTETEAEAPAAKIDTALGGQVFDKWFKVRGYNGDFLPDSKKTEEVDGQGGPNGNGTLNGESGEAVANSGHDYRLKNFFGWDLRGAEGIYGADYQNKSYVLPINLLTDTRSHAELVEWITKGGQGLPAFGDVIEAKQIEAVAGFIVATREGELPQPEQIFSLSKEAPKNYVLNEGGDAVKGAKFFADSCSGCHGAKGDEFMIDDKYTVGAYGRMKAYEGWYKVVNGHPGSPMSRMSSDAQEVLDLFAALCDRTTFPAKDAENEVKDGDLRCGAYLK